MILWRGKMACVRITWLLLFLFDFSHFGTTFATREQIQGGELECVSDLYFLNSQFGWVSISDQQVVYSTSDGGETWSRHPTPTGLYRITFVDPSLGWALGGTSDQDSKPSLGVFKTKDAGRTWTLVSNIKEIAIGGREYLNGILFPDSKTGYLIGAKKGGYSIVLVTHDGGETFSRIEQLSGIFGASRGIFSDKTGGVWITGNESMALSRDNGKHWQDTKPDKWKGGSVIEGGQFANERRGFAVGMRIFSTSDAGSHWEEIVDSKEGQPFGAIHFWDNDHGCAASNTTLLFCTSDGGNSWTKRRVLPVSKNPQQTNGKGFFRMFFMSGGRTGWLLDYDGNLHKTTDMGNTWQPFEFPKNK
jgi:photosystem II stability/assembly factor-like uncharacterized protein